MRKLSLCLILVIVCTSFLTGCWSYTDIDNLSIISGIAIDKAEPPYNYTLTGEILETSGGGETKLATRIIQAQGRTIFEAARNLINPSNKKLYWAHAVAIIISKDVATEGMLPVIDWFSRDNETRLSMELCVSEEETASEILQVKTKGTEIISFQISKLLQNNEKFLSKAASMNVYEFLNLLGEDKVSPVMPVVKIQKMLDTKEIELNGTAVFKKDKLVGFMDKEDSMFYLFATNKISGGIIVPSNDLNSDLSKISLEITESKTNINPHIVDGKIHMDIDIKTKVFMEEDGCNEDVVNEPGRSLLEKSSNEYIENNIQRVIKNVQQDYNSDIFQFGSFVYAIMPEEWDKVKGNWEDIFKDLVVNVHTQIEIKNSGLAKTPIQVVR